VVLSSEERTALMGANDLAAAIISGVVRTAFVGSAALTAADRAMLLVDKSGLPRKMPARVS